MLVLDFINVGNGDSTLIRDMENGVQRFAALVDCGHDSLIRDDHSAELDPRSQRIYAGDFLKKQGVTHLDMVVLTHFHRDPRLLFASKLSTSQVVIFSCIL